MDTQLNSLLSQITDRYSGQYLINKFFIKINTQTRKSQIPNYNYNDHSFPDIEQVKLQQANIITLFHEHIHYVHEISTMVGITQFYFEVVNRAVFSDFVDVPNSSSFLGITGDAAKIFSGIVNTNSAILGGFSSHTENKIIYKIDRIERIPYAAFVPFHSEKMPMHVPVVFYEYTNTVTGKADTDSLNFGKYYLYEGLAHMLDHVMSAKHNIQRAPASAVKPEYKIMELVARAIFPEIIERNMLEVASLSLSYIEPGEMFIRMIEELKNSSDKEQYMAVLKVTVADYLKTRHEGLVFTLERIKSIFKSRNALYAAASHLCEAMKKGFENRMKNPVFEVDISYSGDIKKLTDLVPICDFMYELVDDDDFMKDFSGTQLDNQLSIDLKTLLCHVDYFQASVGEKQGHCCPLYTSCPHQIRQSKAIQCATQPRLSFEDQKDFGWCSYGLGVAYMKGADN